MLHKIHSLWCNIVIVYKSNPLQVSITSQEYAKSFVMRWKDCKFNQ